MANKTIEELKSEAAVVRDATEEGENTATRVGTVLIDMIDSLSNATVNGIKGYMVIDSTSELPTNPTSDQQMIGYLLNTTLYVYVGTGGDTLDGKYKSADLKGPQGATGPAGADGHDGVSLGEVALVNNLKEGGEESALTAEMGKKLGDEIFVDINTSIDTSTLTKHNCSPGANKKWIYDNTYKEKHIVVPITQGRKYAIQVATSTNTGGFWGWLTSAYNPSTTYNNGDTTPYANNGDRNWLSTSTGAIKRTPPEDAAYLVLGTNDGSGKVTTWLVTEIEEDVSVIDIINNNIEHNIEQVDNTVEELSDELFPRNQINISSRPVRNYSMASDGTWKFTNARHIHIPVVEGQEYTITPSVNGNFYAFVTASYSSQPALNSTVPYAPNCTRVWISEATDITVPSGAVTLILVTVDGDGHPTTWSATLNRNKFDEVEKEIENVVDTGITPLFDIFGQHTTSNDYNEAYYTLGAGEKWLYSSAKHIVIPCVEGDVFDLQVTQSTSTGSFMGWLASYSTPSNNQDIDYVAGYDRTWINVSEGVRRRLVAPVGTHYLCLVVKDGDGYVHSWAITKYPINILRNANFGWTPSSYIPIKEGYETYMSLGSQSYVQGGTIYGNYFIQAFREQYKKIKIFDLTTKQLVQEVALPTFSNPRYHNNTISFSGVKYSDDDDFPLLYMCSGYTDTTAVSTTEVYVVRIIGSAGSYTTSLIQTITIDFGIKNGWTEFVCDPINSRAWITGTGVATIICVALPSTSNSAVTINSSTAIIDKFDYTASNYLRIGTSKKASGQGMFFFHNRIYLVHGVPSYDGEGVDALYITVTNTLTKCIEALVPLKNFGLANGTSNTYEPESCFIWNDEFYVAYPSFIAKLIQ